MNGKLLLTPLLSLLCLGLAAQEGYYNGAVGTTLQWVIYDDAGDIFGYCRETLEHFEGDMENARIRYGYVFSDRNGRTVSGNKPFALDVSIESGRTRARINNVARALQSADYLPVGDLSSIPADMEVGDMLRNSEIKVSVQDVYTATNSYRKRRVTAKETVTVLAGSFECYLIEDEEIFTGSGPFRVKTWVARGTGIVRQIIYKKDGSVNQTFELVRNK